MENVSTLRLRSTKSCSDDLEASALADRTIPPTLEPAVDLARFRRLKKRLDAWALSSGSAIAKDYFAALATSGKYDFQALRNAVDEGKLGGIDALGLARLARIVALQSDSD